MTSNTDDRTDDLEMQPTHPSQAHDRGDDFILDIEHVEVEDDPRKWSAARKVRSFFALERANPQEIPIENNPHHDR
jgi:hypothetical protein